MSKLHPSVTPARIEAAARESMFGLSDEGITGAEDLLFEVVT